MMDEDKRLKILEEIDDIISYTAGVTKNVHLVKDTNAKVLIEGMAIHLDKLSRIIREAFSDDRDAIAAREAMPAIYDETEIKKRIAEHLKTLGVPNGIYGFSYIQDAVYLIAISKKGTYNKKVMSVLMKEVGDRHDVTSKSVERCIRHSIDRMMDNIEPEILEKYFGNSIGINSSHPTNTNFLFTLADAIGLECGIL